MSRLPDRDLMLKFSEKWDTPQLREYNGRRYSLSSSFVMCGVGYPETGGGKAGIGSLGGNRRTGCFFTLASCSEVSSKATACVEDAPTPLPRSSSFSRSVNNFGVGNNGCSTVTVSGRPEPLLSISLCTS
jgi:hypothetical protein